MAQAYILGGLLPNELLSMIDEFPKWRSIEKYWRPLHAEKMKGALQVISKWIYSLEYLYSTGSDKPGEDYISKNAQIHFQAPEYRRWVPFERNDDAPLEEQHVFERTHKSHNTNVYFRAGVFQHMSKYLVPATQFSLRDYMSPGLGCLMKKYYYSPRLGWILNLDKMEMELLYVYKKDEFSSARMDAKDKYDDVGEFPMTIFGFGNADDELEEIDFHLLTED